MSKLSPVLACLVLAAACGGTTPPPTTASDPEPTGDKAEPKESPTSHDDEITAKQRSSFMSQCEHTPEQHEFCECSFQVAKAHLTPEEVKNDELSPERGAELKKKITATCTDKLPEVAVRDVFMRGCTAQGATLESFCDCTWTALRKAARVGEIATMDTSTDTRVADSAKSCMTKFPVKKLEADLKSAFLKGCTKDPSVEKFCGCAWTAWRGELSPLEMVLSGTESPKAKAAFEKVKESCKKLAPKKKPEG